MASRFGTPANSTLYVRNLPREVPISEIENLFGKDRRCVRFLFFTQEEEVGLSQGGAHRFSGFVRLRKVRGSMAFVDYQTIDNASRCVSPSTLDNSGFTPAAAVSTPRVLERMDGHRFEQLPQHSGLCASLAHLGAGDEGW